MPEERVCVGCEAVEGDKFLERCRMCYRYFCNDCAKKTHGQRFCSDACVMLFAYGDRTEEDDDVEDGGYDLD